eukprot:c3986_g1_i1.p1 GENE.c3986_g1_i1~~c3986_g1_i1.p1  ORF type:complete len:413 (-),score=61.60 c3986_g1_i1:45-1283(-)
MGGDFSILFDPLYSFVFSHLHLPQAMGNSAVQVTPRFAVTEITPTSFTISWANPPDDSSKWQRKVIIKQGPSTFSLTSSNSSIVCDRLIPNEAHQITTIFLVSESKISYSCVESPPMWIIPDLQTPFQEPPTSARLAKRIKGKESSPKKVLFFGEIGSGKSSLFNAFLTLLREDRYVATTQLTNTAQNTVTRTLYGKEIPGTNISIWDSAGWGESGVPKILAADYNRTFLHKLLSGHYQAGYELIPPFRENSDFYIPKPNPEARFKVVVLTFSCENIGYHPSEKRIHFNQSTEANLLRLYGDIQTHDDVQEGRIRIFLALTKADRLLCTTENYHDSQMDHVNTAYKSSHTDIREIFKKRVARDIRDHFVRRGFPGNQIVFTRGYATERNRREDIDALNCDAFNAMLVACDDE